jgi:hypothetical protein
MMNFDQFLDLVNENSRAGTKTGLYPLGYDGIGNYPPAYLMPSAADTLYYLSIDDRYSAYWEGKPFNIDHLSGDVQEPKGHGMPGWVVPHAKGSPAKMPHYKMPPGDVRKPQDSPLPGKPTKDCLVKKPRAVDPHLAGKATEKSVCASKIPN